MFNILNKDNLVIKDKNPLIIFLMGPTASGKTKLAISLKREKLNVQIISVDSALIYKGMDIGTSKPLLSELAYAPHKLIDIKDPNEYYSVANFYHDAIIEIKKIIKSGSIPLLVGGTMLYFKVLLLGLFNLPKSDQNIRKNLEYEARKIGWINMYNKLKYIDPVASNKIHFNDHKRIIRALEIFLITGTSCTKLVKKRHYSSLKYHVIQFAVMPSSRQILYDRIEKRFYKMLKNGFENEVSGLFKRSELHIGLKSSVSCVGYRQMWKYLSGQISYNDMIDHSIAATRRVAKKQLTWLKKWPHLFWLIDDDIFISVRTIFNILNQTKLSSRYLFRN